MHDACVSAIGVIDVGDLHHPSHHRLVAVNVLLSLGHELGGLELFLVAQGLIGQRHAELQMRISSH